MAQLAHICDQIGNGLMACKIIKQKTNNMNIIKRNEEPRKYQWTKGKRENNKVSHEMKKMRDKRGSRLIYDPSFFIGGISAWVQSRFSMNAGFSKLRPWYSGVLAFSFFFTFFLSPYYNGMAYLLIPIPDRVWMKVQDSHGESFALLLCLNKLEPNQWQ